MLSRDPVLQELNRRAVAKRGVAATPVVKHFDLVEQIGYGVGAGRVSRAVQLGTAYTVHGALMVVGGLLFTWARLCGLASDPDEPSSCSARGSSQTSH